jgi:hypothetical protein
MASVTLSPTTASGSFWTNPTNLTAQDAVYATATIFSSPSYALVGTYPGASIPSGSVIDGIEVMIRRYASGNGANTNTYQVTLPKGTPKDGSPPWPNSPANETFGGPTDLWGTTWTPTDFNSSFNVQFQIAKSTGTTGAYVDYMSVTIYYHPGTVTHDAAAALTLAATITTTAVRQVNGAAALNLAPTITATAQREAVASATLALAATITASAQLELSAAAALNLAPTITAAAVRETQAAAALDWSGTITASAIVVGSDVMHASLTLAPTITVAAIRETDASADLSLDATITADAVVIVTASATLVLEPTITVRAVIKTSAVVLHAIVYGSARETQFVSGAPHTLSATGSAHVVPTVAGAPHTIDERIGSARQIAIMKGSRA